MDAVLKDNFIKDLSNERLKSVFGQEIDWILVDYLDSGKGMLLGKCECGRPLRRQYTVQHVQTGEQKNLGIIHLKKHLNITDAEVNKIRTGINSTFKEIKEIEQAPINNDTQHEINDLVHFADERESLYLNKSLLQLQLGFSLSRRQQDELSVILKELNHRKNEVNRKKDEEERKKNLEVLKTSKKQIARNGLNYSTLLFSQTYHHKLRII